jgi:hypothetical protein
LDISLFLPPLNQRFDFGRSTRTSRNSSGPFVSRRWRSARSAVERAALSDLREGAKVTYDIVPNKGKESAENLKVA